MAAFGGQRATSSWLHTGSRCGAGGRDISLRRRGSPGHTANGVSRLLFEVAPSDVRAPHVRRDDVEAALAAPTLRSRAFELGIIDEASVARAEQGRHRVALSTEVLAVRTGVPTWRIEQERLAELRLFRGDPRASGLVLHAQLHLHLRADELGDPVEVVADDLHGHVTRLHGRVQAELRGVVPDGQPHVIHGQRRRRRVLVALEQHRQDRGQAVGHGLGLEHAESVGRLAGPQLACIPPDGTHT
jgi:hypothetical protein